VASTCYTCYLYGFCSAFFLPKYKTARHFCGIPPLKRTLPPVLLSVFLLGGGIHTKVGTYASDETLQQEWSSNSLFGLPLTKLLVFLIYN
jgi:hypothetical protein